MNFNVINLATRQDRWKHMTETFSAFALKRFEALTDSRGGWVGCLKSHAALLTKLIQEDKGNLGMYVVLEDDCDLLHSQEVFEAKWDKYKKYLSEHMGEWDFFSGGGAYVRPSRVVCHDPFIIECDWSVCTQFVVHTKRSAKTMIDYAAQEKWDTACDNNLSRVHKGKIWLPYPMLCRQLETGKSDIASDAQKEKIKVAFEESAKALDAFVVAEKNKLLPKVQLPTNPKAPPMQNIDLSTALSRHIIWTEGKLEAFKECAMYINAVGGGVTAPVKPQVAFTVKLPNMTLFTNFLSEQECNELISEASKSMHKSKVVGEGGKATFHEARTNSGAFLSRGSSPLIERIEQHISILTGIPIENGEGLQISRYEVGEEYKPHYDYFNPKREDFSDRIASHGQRVATFLIYLSTPEDGGQTTFPDAKIDVPAVMGNALLFRYPKAEREGLTLHGGTPVKAGVKWIAVKWLRDRAFGQGAKNDKPN